MRFSFTRKITYTPSATLVIDKKLRACRAFLMCSNHIAGWGGEVLGKGDFRQFFLLRQAFKGVWSVGVTPSPVLEIAKASWLNVNIIKHILKLTRQPRFKQIKIVVKWLFFTRRSGFVALHNENIWEGGQCFVVSVWTVVIGLQKVLLGVFTPYLERADEALTRLKPSHVFKASNNNSLPDAFSRQLIYCNYEGKQR